MRMENLLAMIGFHSSWSALQVIIAMKIPRGDKEDDYFVISRSGTPDVPFGRGQSCEPRLGRGNLYIDANHCFAGVLASSLQDSLPTTHRITSVRSGQLAIRQPCTQSSLLETSCFERPFAALSFAVCCSGSSYVTRPANTPAKADQQ